MISCVVLPVDRERVAPHQDVVMCLILAYAVRGSTAFFSDPLSLLCEFNTAVMRHVC